MLVLISDSIEKFSPQQQVQEQDCAQKDTAHSVHCSFLHYYYCQMEYMISAKVKNCIIYSSSLCTITIAHSIHIFSGLYVQSIIVSLTSGSPYNDTMSATG